MRQWIQTNGGRIALVAGVLAFLGFVFPTPYEYTRHAPDVWRVNRLTGVREKSTDSGWRTDAAIESEAKARRYAARESDSKKAKSDADSIVFSAGESWNKIRYENPTDRAFMVKGISVEYFDQITPQGRTLLAPYEKMLPSSSGDIDISDHGDPPAEVKASATRGKEFTQRILITFTTDYELGEPYGPFTGRVDKTFTASGE